MTTPTLIDYNQYINNRTKKFIYVRDIKYTLKYYNLNTTGKKPELLKRLDNFFNNLKSKNKFNNQIITIQKYIRGYLIRKKFNDKDYFFRHSCTNNEDFYTFQSIDTISPLYFFSFKNNGFSYFFDIRSFEKLIKNKCTNPYNRAPIPQNAIDKFEKRYEIVKNDKNFKLFETPKLSEEQKYKNYVTEVFQKIDQTGSVAGGTNINWFQNLSQRQLIKLYKILEDIWMYRANLSYEQQKEIVPDGNIFKNQFNNLIKNRYALPKKIERQVEYIILSDIDKLVSSSPNIVHRSTGAYYVLTAFVEISPECAECMPWLIQ